MTQAELIQALKNNYTARQLEDGRHNTEVAVLSKERETLVKQCTHQHPDGRGAYSFDSCDICGYSDL